MALMIQNGKLLRCNSSDKISYSNFMQMTQGSTGVALSTFRIHGAKDINLNSVDFFYMGAVSSTFTVFFLLYNFKDNG